MDNLRSDQLEALCSTFATAPMLTNPPYWSAEIYGFGKYIRKYGHFPSWLPLCVHTDHGAGEVQQFNSELTSSAPVQLFHSPNSVRAWKAVSRKRCYCFVSPFVFCRKANGIEKSAEARGTIAFPAHTTIHLRDLADVGVYMAQLRSLPAEFQPVSICLHATDIGKGLHKEFLAAGFEVFTAGHVYDDAFSERFYSIIRNFKYSTSNHLGSYAYYCVEMGIPFFIYGQEPDYVNIDDSAVPLGKYSPYDQFDAHRNAHDVFAKMTTVISDEQRRFANTHLGVYDGLSRRKMTVVLYYSLVRRLFMWVTVEYAVRLAKRTFAKATARLRHLLQP